MAADALSLLFELDADGRPAVEEFKRVRAAFAAELEGLKKMAETAVKLNLVESRPTSGPNEGAAAGKSTVDSQREVNRQLEAMWDERERQQAASLKKLSDTDRAFADEQVSTAQIVEEEIVKAYKDRESQLSETAKQSEDAWAKHEAAKLAATKQAEKEGEAVVTTASAAKDKAAKIASDNFLKQQKQTASIVARSNAQVAANEIRAALVAAKGTSDISSIASKGIDALSEHLNLFVGHRIPLAGGAFIRLTENVRGFVAISKDTEGSVLRLGNIIADLSSKSGKSAPQIKEFLNSFASLGSQVEKDEAAVATFGAALAQKLAPQLARADTEMGLLANSTAAAGSEIGALAGPIGIAVLAVAALVAGVIVASNEIFDLAKRAADVQGRLLDLSQQTGVAVETLAALEIGFRKTGGSIDSAVQSLGTFQSNLSESFEDRGSKAALTLRQLGVDATDTETALRQTIAALARMPEGFEQTARARALFGRGAAAFLAIAKETGGDLDKITERLKQLGGVTTEEAKLADEFNDQLVDLDIQLRGLGTKAIPVVLDVLKDLSKFLADNRVLFIELQGAVKGLALAIATPLRLAFSAFKAQLEAVATVTERIKAAIEFIIGHPVANPFAAAPTPAQPTAPAAPQVDPFTEQLRDQIASREKLQAVLNFDLAKTQAEARDAIAQSQRDLEAGKIDRAKALEQTIAATKREAEAQISNLEADRRLKLEKAALAKDDIKKQQEFSDQVLAIDAQLVEKRATLVRTEADLRARARLDDQKAESAHLQEQLDTLTRLGADRIAKVEDLINREKVDRATGLQEIEEIENKAIQARGKLLKRELQIAGAGPERQAVLDRIKALEADRTILERQQSERRVHILRTEFEQKRQIFLANLDAFLQLEQARGNAQIAAIQSLAALRIKTEEQAAKDILAIRLRLIDEEVASIEARQQTVKSITDPQERRQAEGQLAAQLKILTAERVAIQDEGNRTIDEKRQEDLENERRYFDDLEEIEERIANIQRDTAQEVIRLMRLRFAGRKNIIRAQRDLDLADEITRHKRASDSIKAQQEEVDTEIRILEQHLKSLKIGTTEEIEQHERLIEELEKLRVKRKALKDQQDAEDQRTKTKTGVITSGTDAALEREDPNSLRSLFGDIFAEAAKVIRASAEAAGEAVSDLTVILGSFGAAAAEHFNNASAQAGNFVSILLDGIDQINAGLADMLENWILTGDTGSAALRKLLASTLAYYAKTFLIKALDNVGEGFSNLAKASAAAAAGNIPSSILYHEAAIKNFISAAKYGLASAGTAIAGRLAAGDAFKQKDTASRAVNGGQTQPTNRTFNLGGQGPVESSSQSAREGSGGTIWERLVARVETLQQQNLDLQRQQQLHNAQVNETLARMRTARAGDVVTMGAADARQAIGVAVIDHSNSSGDFNESLQRNLGLA
jgi:hypothetical protein